MLFNSLEFLIFFIVLFISYWHIIPQKINNQNLLLFLASILFYGFWDIRFLGMLFTIISIDYYFGIKISENSGKKALFYLIICLINNLGILFYFKYANFFIQEYNSIFNKDQNLLNLIIPIGISFYTFHGISYVIDIYRKRISPEKNYIQYALFVSYFPLLVAGPIERATHLLPQINSLKKFNYNQAKEGVKLIIYGLFKKIVIADTIATFVNPTFENYHNYTAYSLILAAIGFSIQIYCDFSGYSDIAIGCSKLLGIELLSNFRFPYFSESIKEFWRRWHISLTSWFKDYVYIPLGGNKLNSFLRLRNIFIVFMISALWHGGKITFLIWGFIHFIMYFIEDVFIYKIKIQQFTKIQKVIKKIFIFSIVTIAWIFFRSDNVESSIGFIKQVLLNCYENPKNFLEFSPNQMILYYSLFFILVDWVFRKNERDLDNVKFKYLGILFVNLIFFHLLSQSEESFIYFQF